MPVRLACFCFFTALAMAFMMATCNAEPQAPRTYDAWSIECKPRIGNPESLCVASQLVTAGKKAKQVILGVMVASTPEHPLPHIIFRLSQNANIEKGAAVKIDEQESFRVPISKCDTHICEVRSLIPEALLSQMRAGKLLKFAFFLDNKEVTYPVSLDGFDKAYMALQVQATPK